VYKYLSLLRKSPLEKFHHDEISAIADIHFKFTEKERAEDYVSSLAETMGEPYLREHILSGPTRVREWDEHKIRELLDTFTPEKSRVMVMAKEFKGDSEWEHETWYQTEYRVRKLDPELIEQVSYITNVARTRISLPYVFRDKRPMTYQNFSYLAPTLSYRPIWRL